MCQTPRIRIEDCRRQNALYAVGYFIVNQKTNLYRHVDSFVSSYGSKLSRIKLGLLNLWQRLRIFSVRKEPNPGITGKDEPT
jgi:hypothetical protein